MKMFVGSPRLVRSTRQRHLQLTSDQGQNSQELELCENVPEQAKLLQGLNFSRRDLVSDVQRPGVHETLPGSTWILLIRGVATIAQQRFCLGMREQK